MQARREASRKAALPACPAHSLSLWLHLQARREAMRAEGLEAENRLLATAEQRASAEATEVSRERFRLAAELGAARNVHADREGELVREVARLKEEVRQLRVGGRVCPGRAGGLTLTAVDVQMRPL